ncbi:alpha/beta hydrolase [Rhodohalobacter sp. SW132]|uniref:alpha/beta fold hydrolase n=1 Tax=Rhodohalobacter sp. SW132 TaxID=2293433 RepID=UPI000E232BE9|nr:alpha/beta hydrolase [Rhodohalobacter sp. SW132]REL37870.1 alpha/beta hydrolase [Rhodohalobacter sp. SW132]
MKQSAVKRNNITQFGKGEQPMMFAHGYGCDQNMWRFITPEFEIEYKIVLFDHTGSGQSDESAYDFEKYDSLQGYAQDIIEICDELKLRNVILVSHSVSCMIGVLAAIQRPDLFDKLILIGPSPRYINDDSYYGGFSGVDIEDMIETLESNYLGWSSHITPIIAGHPEKPKYSGELYNSFCRMNPDIAKHFAKVTFLGDNRNDLPMVKVPVQIIQSNPDVIASVDVGKFVHQKIQNSLFTQIEVPGHLPHLTNPDATISAIKQFL